MNKRNIIFYLSFFYAFAVNATSVSHKNVRTFTDSTNLLTFEQIKASDFTTGKEGSFNIGFSDHTHWFVLKNDNSSEIIQITSSEVDLVEVVFVNKDGN